MKWLKRIYPIFKIVKDRKSPKPEPCQFYHTPDCTHKDDSPCVKSTCDVREKLTKIVEREEKMKKS